MAKTSKKLKAAYEAVDRDKAYPLDEAVALVKGNASSKFDETIEIAMNLGVDPRHADQMVRGGVSDCQQKYSGDIARNAPPTDDRCA